jgi:hypothetical protein
MGVSYRFPWPDVRCPSGHIAAQPLRVQVVHGNFRSHLNLSLTGPLSHACGLKYRFTTYRRHSAQLRTTSLRWRRRGVVCEVGDEPVESEWPAADGVGLGALESEISSGRNGLEII